MPSTGAAIVLIFLSCGLVFAQDARPSAASSGAASLSSVELEVPAGTPLPVVLDSEVRVRKAGQPIRGKIAEPVYAFDKLVVPAGSEVEGSITRLASVPKLQRTLAALDANFSPYRDAQITFDQLVLPDGRRIPLRTQVSAASQGVLQFATAAGSNDSGAAKKQNGAMKLAAASLTPDGDAASSGQSFGEMGGRAANGASGFRAIRFAMDALVRSRALASAFGVYGAGMSVYGNFLSRGHDVIYPKDTAMAIGFGSRVTAAPKAAPHT